jgi:NitT/TauT family transport system substrate-binding protein
LFGCTTPEAEIVTLKLNWEHSIQFLGFYIAQEKGFYAEAGLEISLEPLLNMDDATRITERVADGTFDFGLGGELLVSGQLQGIPTIAIASIVQLSPAVFFARADSGIVTPADLGGQRIVVKNDVWESLLLLLLTDVGLTLEDVELVAGGFDMTPFYEGEVDVWAGFLTDEVVQARQQGLELVTFPLYEYGLENVAMPLFTNQSMLESQSDIALRFTQASIRGWEWAVENPTEAVDIMLERYPELADERDFHLVSFNAYIPLVRPPDVQIGSIDCERWLNNERFDALDSREGLCTTEIFERVIIED